jgi:hypothetical protein
MSFGTFSIGFVPVIGWLPYNAYRMMPWHTGSLWVRIGPGNSDG